MRQAKSYFSSAEEEVVHWWDPEGGITEAIYKHGLEEVTRRMSRYPNIKFVLDAACGKGRITKKLSQHYLVTAIDISEQMIRRVQTLGLQNVCIEKADVEHLPFSNETFDAVVCLEALVHFDNLENVFLEFNRVLKPGGILIVDFDNKYGLIRILKNFFDYFFKKFDNVYRNEREWRMSIFTTLIKGEVISLIKKCNFKIRDKFFIGVIMPFKLKNNIIISPKLFSLIKPLNSALEKIPLLNRLATYIYLVCQK